MVSEGKIKELGTHDELIALNGLYADLVSAILHSPFTLSLLLMPCFALYLQAFLSFSLPRLSSLLPCFAF